MSWIVRIFEIRNKFKKYIANKPLLSAKFFLPLLLILLGNFVTKTTFAEEIKLKLGHIDPKGSLYFTVTEEFARRFNEKAKGKAQITIYRAGELGTEAEMLNQVQRGDTDLALLGQIMPTISPEFGVFELPYLVLSRDHIRRVRSLLLSQYLQPAAQKRGFRVLAMWENGFRHITNNVRPIQTPKDLKGLRIRVNQGGMDHQVFRSFGASPVPTNLDAAYMLLKRNELDGEHNPMSLLKNRRFYEVQKFLSLTKHNYLPAFLLISEARFQQLDPVVQKALSDIAWDMQNWALAEGEKLDRQLTETLSGLMAVNEIDTLAFVMASLPVYQQFSQDIPHGKELIKLLYDPSSLLAKSK